MSNQNNYQTITIAMQNPNNCENNTSEFLQSYNITIREINELPNPNQPDVTLYGKNSDLISMLSSDEFNYTLEELTDLNLI